ncbi:hypothetical protein M422DRAFT_238660 [Sphaerobolus stellatus SS14]|nr:hypothetical protein M422DRAFT_238660 [Sphaerobolus stellatus SS14]
MTSRYNLEALKSAADKVMNKVAVEIHKFGGGGFNQVFGVVFDDGTDLVARVNCSRADIEGNATQRLHSLEFLQSGVASEAATLKFFKENTTIPVHISYSVDLEPDNAVGMRYMLQEWICRYLERSPIVGQHVTPLRVKVSEEEQERVFKQVIDIEKQLLELSFPSLGSLIDDPMTGKCANSSEGLLKGYARYQYDFIVSHTTLWKEARRQYALANGNGDNPPPFSFLEIFYRLYMDGVQQLRFDKEVSFILHEWDLNDFIVAYNDTARIVGIVGWQSTYVLPIWSIVFDDYAHIRNDCLTEEVAERWSALRLRSSSLRLHRSKMLLGKNSSSGVKYLAS